MRVISRNLLIDHAERDGRSDSLEPLRAWAAEMAVGRWRSAMEIRAQFPTAAFLPQGDVAFEIVGAKYCVVARFNFPAGVCRLRFVGTQMEFARTYSRAFGGVQ